MEAIIQNIHLFFCLGQIKLTIHDSLSPFDLIECNDPNITRPDTVIGIKGRLGWTDILRLMITGFLHAVLINPRLVIEDHNQNVYLNNRCI